MRLSEPLWPAIAGVVLLFGILRFGGKAPGWKPVPLALISAFLISLASLHPVWGSSGPREGIKVMQLNMRHGLDGVDKVAALIERESPDILTLEEAGPLSYYPEKAPPSMKRALAGYRVYHSHFEAIAVRGEILERELIPLDEMSTEKEWFNQKVIVSVRAKVKGRRLRILGLHFSPRGPKKASYIPGHVEFARVRRSQHEALVEVLKQRPEEATIIAGDFNGQPIGPNYRLIASMAKDCFAEAGGGFGYTIRANFPHKRVDYVFVRNLKPASCYVLTEIVSDHRAVVAWVK